MNVDNSGAPTQALEVPLLLQLPRDLLTYQIFADLTPRELAPFARTCKVAHRVCRDEKLWAHYLHTYFPGYLATKSEKIDEGIGSLEWVKRLSAKFLEISTVIREISDKKDRISNIESIGYQKQICSALKMNTWLAYQPNLEDPFSSRVGRGLAHVAATFGWEEVLLLLISSGIRLDSQDQRGMTPVGLLLSPRSGYPFSPDSKLMSALAERVDNPLSAPDRDGRTPLHYAAQHVKMPPTPYRNLISFLLDNGCDLKSRDSEGCTPLHLAAGAPLETSSHENFKTLIILGGEANAQDHRGWTPLFYAAQTGVPLSLVCLFSMGGNPKIRDKGGNSWLDYLTPEKKSRLEASIPKDFLPDRK